MPNFIAAAHAYQTAPHSILPDRLIRWVNTLSNYPLSLCTLLGHIELFAKYIPTLLGSGKISVCISFHIHWYRSPCLPPVVQSIHSPPAGSVIYPYVSSPVITSRAQFTSFLRRQFVRMLVGYSTPCLPIGHFRSPGSPSYVNERCRRAQHGLMLRSGLTSEPSIQWPMRVRCPWRLRIYALHRISCEFHANVCEHSA